MQLSKNELEETQVISWCRICSSMRIICVKLSNFMNSDDSDDAWEMGCYYSQKQWYVIVNAG